MTASLTARPDAIRRHNLALILGHVHRDGELTRAELTQRLGVSRSTIGALVADLIELGLVDESVPSGGDRVGRPSHVVGPHPEGPFVVAVDIDVTHIKSAAIGLGGLVLARDRVPTGPDRIDPADVAESIADAVERLSAGARRASGPIGIGVSVPGTVDPRTGTVGVAPNLGWRRVALAKMIADRVTGRLPVTVGNDANLSVLAEFSRGNARDCDDVVYLIGRVGVGAGIIVNGAPLRGRDGRAGEIGHNVVDTAGPPCHCGKNGCLETYIGDVALLTLARRQVPPSDEQTESVLAAARAGDAVALSAVRTVAESVGRALGSLANTLNPQRVILGGSLSGVLDIARDHMQQALAQYTFDATGSPIELFRPRFGADSAMLGAAELAFAELLEDPLGGRVLLPR